MLVAEFIRGISKAVGKVDVVEGPGSTLLAYLLCMLRYGASQCSYDTCKARHWLGEYLVQGWA